MKQPTSLALSAQPHAQSSNAFYNQAAKHVADSQNVITDLDNPLIDRDLSLPVTLVSPMLRPKTAPVYYRQYELPDFYQPTQTSVASHAPSIAVDSVRDTTAHTALSPTAHPQPSDALPAQPAKPSVLSQAEIERALANPNIHINLLKQSHSLLDNRPKVQDSLSELEQDLATDVPLDDDKDHAAYQNAVSVWQQQPDDAHAYAVISDSAAHGLADARLRQALVVFRGSATLGITPNSQQAFGLIEAAAKQGDARAAKALSKLYFAGEGVALDMAQGRFWLAQAAENGHVGAQAVLASMAAADGLKQTQQADNQYLQRLAIATAVLVVIASAVIVWVKI